MELLDRYLYEVRRYLPPAQQDDIVAEISDAIQSEFEDRERQLGRPLTGSEQAEIIKAFGHPKLVASRYQPAQYLIGPEVFPFYWFTLKIALAAALALELAGALVAALLSPSPLPAFLKNIFFMWPTIFLVLGVVTFIFVAIERTGSGPDVLTKLGIQKWNPRALPRTFQGDVSRFSLIIEAFANTLFMLWLLDFVPLRRAVGYVITIGGGSQALAPFTITPNWHPLFVLAIVAAALVVLQDFVLLTVPRLAKVRAATLLCANLLLLIGACMILPSHSFVGLTHPSSHAYETVAQVLNKTAYLSLAMLAAGVAIAAAFNIRSLLQRTPQPDLNVYYETRAR